MGRRARVPRLLPFAAFGGALAFACNALTGLDADYHVATDAQAADDEVNRPDVSRDDVAVPDTSTGDTGVDAPRCGAIDAANVEFCSDFEDPDAGASSYLKTNVTDASVVVVPGMGMGGTGGLVVSMMRSGGAASSSVWFAKGLPVVKLPRDFEHYSIEVDVKASATALDYLALAILAFADDATSGTDYGVALYTDALSKLNGLDDAGAVASNASWHHIDVELSRIGAGPSFTRKMTIDATTIDTSTVTPPTTGRSEVRLGAFYTSANGGSFTATFDRLVIRRW